MGDYRSLRVWQTAHRLALQVYEASQHFPAVERYGLTSQVRRAASSIPANLAEGCGRDTDAELARYCRIALGSANELDYHLLLSRDLEMLTEDQHAHLAESVRQVKHMLARLISKLSTDSRQPTADSH